MNRKHNISIAIFSLIAVFLTASQPTNGQIPNQLAQDFVAGEPPSLEDVAKYEKEAEANPSDLRLVRKLGKAYFFRFFGAGQVDFEPKARKTLERALTLTKDDPETLAYLGSLHVLRALRIEKKEAAKQKASFDKGFEILKLAEKLEPQHGAVISIASASYLWLPDSYGMAPHVVEMIEGMRKAMGPYFKKFAHHGQQRLLLTLGQAYVRVGQSEKAIPLFEEALAVNGTSHEAEYLRAELKKLGR
jgi:tetratricopeptide (TPR) repeat protein